ncbi:MAG: hypothetical protein QXX17_07500 [Conexivisphaerales archaeon]
MSSYRELAKGAVPAIILAVTIVLAFHFYYPIHLELSKYPNLVSNQTNVAIQQKPATSSLSGSGVRSNSIILYTASFFIALFLSFAAYFLVRKNYS